METVEMPAVDETIASEKKTASGFTLKEEIGELTQDHTAVVDRPPCRRKERQKQLHSAYLFVSFISLGMIIALHGPTLLDLLIILDVSLVRANAIFSGGGIGFLCGSAIGGIIYDKWNKALTLFMSTFVSGLITIAVPWCFYPSLMAVTNVFRSGVIAALDTGGNTMMVDIWGKDVGPYMQALHFTFGLGTIISPFVAEPFLYRKVEMELDTNYTASDFVTNITAEENRAGFQNNDTMGKMVQSLTGNITLNGADRQTDVFVPYLITGLLVALTSFPFIHVYFSKKTEVRKNTEDGAKGEKEGESRHVPLTLPTRISLLVLLGLMYASYTCVENGFSGLLMTFVVEHLDWTKTKGAQITSMFWISFTVGRLISIGTAKVFKSWTMLAMDFALLTTSFLVLVIGAQRSETVCWISTVLIGLAMASIFPAGITWIDEKIMKMTGKMTSFLLVCASLGSMADPILIGYLFENVSPMWFLYILLFHCVLQSICFGVTSFLVQRMHKQWNCKPRPNENLPLSPTKDDSDFLELNTQNETSSV